MSGHRYRGVVLLARVRFCRIGDNGFWPEPAGCVVVSVPGVDVGSSRATRRSRLRSVVAILPLPLGRFPGVTGLDCSSINPIRELHPVVPIHGDAPPVVVLLLDVRRGLQEVALGDG